MLELCRIGANQGLTAEIDWNYTSWSRRCRKILIGLVVRDGKTVVVRVKSRISTQNRKNHEMTVPIIQNHTDGRLSTFFSRDINKIISLDNCKEEPQRKWLKINDLF